MKETIKTPEEAMDELRTELAKAFPGGFVNGEIGAFDGNAFLMFKHEGVQFRLALFDEHYFALYGWKTNNADTLWERVGADEPNLSDRIWLTISAYLSR